MISKFNGTSTPKRSYCAKTGDNDWNVNLSRCSLRTALCESIRYQAKSAQNVRQDLIPRVRHGEAALCTPAATRTHTSSRDLVSQFNGTSTPKGSYSAKTGDNDLHLFVNTQINH